MQIKNHRLSEARFAASPNFDERPENTPLSLIVIHAISLPPEHFGGNYIEQLFTNCLNKTAHPSFEEIAHLKVSAHLLIRRDGEIVQFVPFDKRAWHAGQSCYQGRSGCNDFSIGIELEGSDNQFFEAAQYLSLSQVIAQIQQIYSLDKTAVIGHEHIAPARKTDPGPCFDWTKLSVLLGVELYPEIQIAITER